MRIETVELIRLSGSRTGPNPDVPFVHPHKTERIAAGYVKILTDTGIAGLFGPLDIDPSHLIPFAKHLIGRDPLQGETLWREMHRDSFRFGHKNHGVLSALTAIDNALWDLRGKHCGMPVYQLLGGPTRKKVRVYASALCGSREPDIAREQAKALQEAGFTAQKWFLRKWPSWNQDPEDLARHTALAQGLRETLGDSYDLMFDAVMTWDLTYALRMARKLADFNPLWLEEPLPSTQLEGFRRIKREVGIPLAAGEHLYTRMELKPYLDAGVLDYAQCDTDWSGGITELTKVCAFAETYGTKVIPHGSNLVSSLHVIASQMDWVCPMQEYLVGSVATLQHFHKQPLLATDGYLTLPKAPGLGIEIDESKVESSETICLASSAKPEN